MTDQTIELRDLVDQLTKPHPYEMRQQGTLIGTRTDDALLALLAQARTTMIGTGGGGRAAHERSALNIAAVELHLAIQTRIRGWAITADVPRHWTLTNGTPLDWTDPAALLRAWHTRTLGNTHFDERPYIATLAGWINTITDLLIDPPRRWTLDAPCPLCGHRYVIDPDGHQIDALGVIEREPADASITACRACEAVWNGINGARTLRIAIDDAARGAA